MLKRRARNLAVTGITIVSATMLTVLAATGASATTMAATNPGHAQAAASNLASANPAVRNVSAIPDTTLPTCYSNGTLIPWTCVQVTGVGLDITKWGGWAHATGFGYFGNSLHIELYLNRYGPYGPATQHSIPEQNCNGFSLNPGENSPPCNWKGAPYYPVDTGYYCSALWWHEDAPTQPWDLLGFKCVYVYQ